MQADTNAVKLVNSELQEAAAKEQQELEKTLKDHKTFVSATLKAQAEILSSREKDSKSLVDEADAARAKAAEARSEETDMRRQVAECCAESDASVTALVEVAKKSEQVMKEDKASTASKIAKLEAGAKAKMDKLVDDTAKANEAFEAELGAAKDAEAKRAEAVSKEEEKRRKGIQETREKVQQLQNERKVLTPQITSKSFERREAEAEMVKLSARYDDVDLGATEQEKTLIEAQWELEARLAKAKQPSEAELELRAQVKKLEAELAKASIERDIEDAELRAQAEALINSTETSAAALQTRILRARQGISNSRFMYSTGLQKAVKEQMKMHQALKRTLLVRADAVEYANEQNSEVNTAKAKLLVFEQEGGPKAKKQKGKK